MESYIKPVAIVSILIGLLALFSIFVLETNDYFKMNRFYKTEIEKLKTELENCKSQNK